MSSLSTTASSKSKFNKKGSKTGSTKNKRGSMEEIPKADDNKKDLKSSQSQKSLEAKGAEVSRHKFIDNSLFKNALFANLNLVFNSASLFSG